MKSPRAWRRGHSSLHQRHADTVANTCTVCEDTRTTSARLRRTRRAVHNNNSPLELSTTDERRYSYGAPCRVPQKKKPVNKIIVSGCISERGLYKLLYVTLRETKLRQTNVIPRNIDKKKTQYIHLYFAIK